MNYHYMDSLNIAEDLTNKIDKIIEERYNDGREAGKSDLMDVLDKIRAEIEAIEEGITSYHNDRPWIFKDEVLEIIDKYRKESKDV